MIAHRAAERRASDDQGRRGVQRGARRQNATRSHVHDCHPVSGALGTSGIDPLGPTARSTVFPAVPVATTSPDGDPHRPSSRRT
jgi:hypothetical protein